MLNHPPISCAIQYTSEPAAVMAVAGAMTQPCPCCPGKLAKTTAEPPELAGPPSLPAAVSSTAGFAKTSVQKVLRISASAEGAEKLLRRQPDSTPAGLGCPTQPKCLTSDLALTDASFAERTANV
jgi:hypothetical protein